MVQKITFKEFLFGEQLDEAGRVHVINTGKFPPRGAPEEKARIFDKVNPKTGARPNRSVLKKMAASGDQFYALEYMHEEDYIAVHVMNIRDAEEGGNYYGINVIFFADGKVDASTADAKSEKQWKHRKNEIVRVAKHALKHDKTLPHAHHGLGGVEALNPGGDYHDYLDPKTNESK